MLANHHHHHHDHHHHDYRHNHHHHHHHHHIISIIIIVIIIQSVLHLRFRTLCGHMQTCQQVGCREWCWPTIATSIIIIIIIVIIIIVRIVIIVFQMPCGVPSEVPCGVPRGIPPAVFCSRDAVTLPVHICMMMFASCDQRVLRKNMFPLPLYNVARA
jgi:hypothetical protein